MHLRWVVDRNDQGYVSRVLKQMWATDEGKTEWREVSEIEKENEHGHSRTDIG